MSERKNIKRNKTRLKVKDLPFRSGMQHNYSKKPEPPQSSLFAKKKVCR